MTKTYVGIGILSLSLLLFVHPVPSTFATDVASSDPIRELQTILLLKGYYDGRIDGLNGSKTERAILRYEQQLGWPLTGKPSERLTERLRAETAAPQGVVRGNDDHTNPKVEAESTMNKKIEALTRDINHMQAHVADTTLAMKRMQRSNVDHFISVQSELRTEGLPWITILVALLGIGVTVIGDMAIKYRVKRLRKEHRKMIDISRAGISTYIFCVLGNRCIDLYAHLNPVSDRRYHGYLDMGVNLSTIAYQNAMYLRDNYSKLYKQGLSDDLIKTINACINNYVFYLGERAYKETLLYAKLNLGWERCPEIQRELQHLFDDIRVPKRWTEKIKDRYEQHYNAARHLTGSEVIDLTIRTGQ